MAEQILIEFIADSSQLQPTIDVLEQLGAIDTKAADAFRKSNAELAKRVDVIKKVNAEESKQLPTLQKTEKAVISLTNAFVDGFQETVVEAVAEAGASVDDFNNGLKSLAKTTEQTEDAQVSLKKQLKEMTAQLAQLEVQGKRNTKEYQDLVSKAGEMKDAIGDAGEAIANAGSDTRNMDNLISLAGGVAGGFAVAQGAAALFGSENEEVQKALLKVNAAMAILQGLQQIQDLMSKRQFASLGLLVGMQRVQAAQTTLQTAAESESVVVRWLAVVAQRALNAAMAANPLGLLIAAIVAVVAAYKIFTSTTENNIETQTKQNKAILDEIKLREELKALMATDIGTESRRQSNDLAYLQARGKRQDLILKQEIEIARARQYYAQENYRRNQDAIDQMDAWGKQLNEIGSELNRLQSLNNDDNKEEIANLETQQELLRKKYSDAKVVAEEYYNANRDAKLKEIELENYMLEIAKRNADALFEIEKRRLERQAELYKKTVDKSPAEFYNLRVQAQKAYTQKEIELQNLQMEHELKNAKLTKDERMNIENKYSVEISRLREQNNDRLSELLMDRNQLIKKANEQAREDEKAMYAELLKMQEQAFTADPNAHKDRVDGELSFIQAGFEQMAVLRNTDYLKRKTALEKERSEGRMGEDNYQKELLKLNQSYSEDVISLQLDRVNRQLQEVDKGSMEEAKLLNEKAELENQLGDLQLEKFKKREELKNQIVNAGFQVASQLAEAFFAQGDENRKAETDAELQALADRRANEVDNKNLTEGQKAEIDKRYKAQENQIKKRAFEADKQAKREQAIINGALAVTNILATMPKFDFGVASALAIAAAVVTTAIQVAKINSSKYTGFRGGGYTGDKGLDDVAGVVHGREYVAHAEATKRYRPALEAMNRLEFDKYIASQIPSVDPEELSSYSIGPNGISFDYDRLGKSIAKHVPDPVQNNFSFDKDGMSFHLIEKGNKTTIRNNRYKTT